LEDQQNSDHDNAGAGEGGDRAGIVATTLLVVAILVVIAQAAGATAGIIRAIIC
jgi:hypothetical protein